MARWNVHFDFKVDTDDRELIALHAEIESYRLSIMEIPLPPSKQRELDQINMIRQIKGTTGIEGNNLSEDEIRYVIESGEAKREAELETKNAYKVQQFIRQRVKRLGNEANYITEELIRELHSLNTEGLYTERNLPGRYREINVSAGDFTPPDYQEVGPLMRRFVEVINSNDVMNRLTPLIRAILAHFYLITIHPFADGNGRTSRALEAYILYAARYNVRGFYSLANYHYQHRDEYIEQLNRARFVDNGNLTSFVKYCMRAFLHELKGVQQAVLQYVRAVMFKDFVMESLHVGVINSRMVSILEYLIDGGRLTTEEYRSKRNPLIAELYKSVTAKTAQRDLRKLMELRLVVEREKRLYANIDIMKHFID